MRSVRKYLVYGYVPIMERTFRSGTRQSCVAQQSIYVILGGSEEKRRYINQVGSELRLLMSNIIYEFTVIQGKHFKQFVSSILFETTPKCNICTTVEKLGSSNFKISLY